MPKKFTECVKRGGRVRTKSFDGKYIHICFNKKTGKSVAGEVKKKKK